jgi:hypothetical protein
MIVNHGWNRSQWADIGAYGPTGWFHWPLTPTGNFNSTGHRGLRQCANLANPRPPTTRKRAGSALHLPKTALDQFRNTSPPGPRAATRVSMTP